jgi:predicted HTH transcriptional regulator
MQITVELSEADLLARMRNFENHLVERKTVKDEKDWKKTAVAFANSVAVGVPAVLYIGVRDNGDIETPQQNLDEAQKKFNRQMERVFPRIAYVPKIINDNGRQVLAVIIPGSGLRPHFAGLSYVRRGSESIEASEHQFAELIAQRNSKAALLLEYKGKNVTVFIKTRDSEIPWPTSTVLVACNQFYVTLKKFDHEPPHSFPLSRVEINFDNLKNTLQLEISDPNRNAWNVQLERQVHQIVGFEMTHEGQLVLNYLLRVGKAECTTQFFPEISADTQTKQMDIAVKHGIVRREQEKGGLFQTYLFVNAEYVPVLKKVLPELLK